MMRVFLAFAFASLWSANSLIAQPSYGVIVSPSSATLMVGESRSFRLVDNSAHVIKNVDWSAVDTGIVEVSGDDEVRVTALRTGNVTLRARGGHGTAYAHIEVIDGARPRGTVEWNSRDVAGCRVLGVDQVRVVGNGPGVMTHSQCSDGLYLNAYSPQGVFMWRFKLGAGSDATDATPNSLDTGASSADTQASMETRASSICDSISDGMNELAVAQLMVSRHLRPMPKEQTMWVIEEDNAKCTLWFSAFKVEKKRKTLTSE
jgi:hypothetical protein